MLPQTPYVPGLPVNEADSVPFAVQYSYDGTYESSYLFRHHFLLGFNFLLVVEFFLKMARY